MDRLPFVVLYMFSSAGIWATHIWFFTTQQPFSPSVLLFLYGSAEPLMFSRAFMIVVGPLAQIVLALSRAFTVRRAVLVLLPLIDVVVLYGGGLLSFIQVGIKQGSWAYYVDLLGAPLLCGLILDPLCCVLAWKDAPRRSMSRPTADL